MLQKMMMLEKAVKGFRQRMIDNGELKPLYASGMDVVEGTMGDLKKLIDSVLDSAEGRKKYTDSDFERIVMEPEKSILILHKQILIDEEVKHTYGYEVDTIVSNMLDLQEMLAS